MGELVFSTGLHRTDQLVWFDLDLATWQAARTLHDNLQEARFLKLSSARY
jgi:hypothetical protein